MKNLILQLSQALLIADYRSVVPKEPIRNLTEKELLTQEYKELLHDIKDTRKKINNFISRIVNNTCPKHEELIVKSVDESLDLLVDLKRSEARIKESYVRLVKEL